MTRLLHNIVRLRLVFLIPLLSALAPAMAQMVVYQGNTTQLSVVQVPGHTYKWDIYSDITVNFAVTQGNCPVTSATFVGNNSGATAEVLWLEQGIYFYKVTAYDGANCAMNFKIGMIKVIPPEVVAVITGITRTGACQQIKLDASGSVGDIVKYEWTVSDQGGALTRPTGVTTEFLLSPAYAGSLPADFNVTLKVTSNKGYTHSKSISIRVDALPEAEVYSSGKLEKDGSMVVNGSVSTGTAISYRWFSTEGKIVGADNEPTVKLFGAGIYSLEVIDNYGCKSLKSFKFPLEVHQIFASPDYARTSWAQDTTIDVLANDRSSVKFLPGTVRILVPPVNGQTRINANGSITYIPVDRRPGRDEFVYEVCDELKLCASATVTVDIYDSGVTAPEGFSPNGDGANDRLVFIGLPHYPKSQLTVFTRSGQLVYQNNDYQNDWDGTTNRSSLNNLQHVPTGTYYYILKLGDTNRSLKGFVYIGY